MKDVNKVMLLGRLGADPIQRQTQSGVVVANFPIATSRKYKKDETEDGEGTLAEETQWHQVVTWGKQAQSCALYLRKGQKVFVEGMIRSHKYSSKTGEEKVAFEVHAESVSFLESRKNLDPETLN